MSAEGVEDPAMGGEALFPAAFAGALEGEDTGPGVEPGVKSP